MTCALADALYDAHLATLVGRTTEALAATGWQGLLLHSGLAPTAFLDDQHYPFRVNPPFKAWMPLLDAPDCFLYFEPGERPRIILNAPDDYWHRPAELPEAGWTRSFDVARVGSREAARAALPSTLHSVAVIGERWPGIEAWGLGAVNPSALVAWLDFQRAVKTPYERECLRRASELGARGHLAAEQAFRAAASEYEIAQAFIQATGLREQELPYNPIVALNQSGAVLHYQQLERIAPSRHRSLLIDAGAAEAGYASDITRTLCAADGDFSALVLAMDELQQSLCGAARSGADWRDLHLTAHRLIAELLRDAGIITADAEAAVESGLSGVFFPHGVGHLLGLQVHDVGGLLAGPDGGEIARPAGHAALRLTRVLEPGFVVTMEPGIYFIDQLLGTAAQSNHRREINWPRVEQLRCYGGIRIEDNLVVTPGGEPCENLTRAAFAALSP